MEIDGTLVIDKVDEKRDMGMYACYAESFLGNDTGRGSATVYGKGETTVTVEPR